MAAGLQFAGRYRGDPRVKRLAETPSREHSKGSLTSWKLFMVRKHSADLVPAGIDKQAKSAAHNW
jgi:hypothetical protein